MYCRKCGSKLEENAVFCTNCGARQTEGTASSAQQVQQPVCPPPPPTHNGQAHGGSVSFGQAIKLFFTNYTNFTGRASRSEYWWAFLFNFLVSLVIFFIPIIGIVLSVIWSLAVLIPGLSITIRRLHDTGKCWVYLLMGFIPLAGPIILLVFYCTASDGDNKWGPGPNVTVYYGNAQYAPQGNNAGAVYHTPADKPVVPNTPEIHTEAVAAKPMAPQAVPSSPQKSERKLVLSYNCDGETHRAEVKEYPCTIGRDSSAVQIFLSDTKVSRVHAQIVHEGQAILIQDLQSSNGTVVNGAVITEPTKIASGDEIVIGTTRLSVQMEA